MCEQRLATGRGSGKCRRRRPANLLLERVRSDHQARSRTSLSVLFSEKAKTRLVLSHRVSRNLDGMAAVVPRVQALGCHVHFAQPLIAYDWRQNSLTSMSEKMMKAVVNGCAWGLRDSQGSLLNRSWQVLTTSPYVQRVLYHRICDKKHKHGRLLDLSSEPSLQCPKYLC